MLCSFKFSLIFARVVEFDLRCLPQNDALILHDGLLHSKNFLFSVRSLHSLSVWLLVVSLTPHTRQIPRSVSFSSLSSCFNNLITGHDSGLMRRYPPLVLV